MEPGTKRELTSPRSFAALAFAFLAGAAMATVLTMVWSRDHAAATAPVEFPAQSSSAELARLADRIDVLAAEVAALRAMPRTVVDRPDGSGLTATTAVVPDLENVRQLILKLVNEGKAESTVVEIQAALANKREMDLAAVGRLYEQLVQDETEETRRAYRFLSKRQIIERLGPPTHIEIDEGNEIWCYAFMHHSGEEMGINFSFREGYVIGVY